MKPTIYKYGFIAFGRKIFESFFILAYFLDFIMNKQRKHSLHHNDVSCAFDHVKGTFN